MKNLARYLRIILKIGSWLAVALLAVSLSVIPSVSGLLCGALVIWVGSDVIVRKYGDRTIGSFISKETVLRMGILPILVLLASSVLLTLTLVSGISFLGTLLSTLAWAIGWLLATLGVMARNPK